MPKALVSVAILATITLVALGSRLDARGQTASEGPRLLVPPTSSAPPALPGHRPPGAVRPAPLSRPSEAGRLPEWAPPVRPAPARAGAAPAPELSVPEVRVAPGAPPRATPGLTPAQARALAAAAEEGGGPAAAPPVQDWNSGLIDNPERFKGECDRLIGLTTKLSMDFGLIALLLGAVGWYFGFFFGNLWNPVHTVQRAAVAVAGIAGAPFMTEQVFELAMGAASFLDQATTEVWEGKYVSSATAMVLIRISQGLAKDAAVPSFYTLITGAVPNLILFLGWTIAVALFHLIKTVWEFAMCALQIIGPIAIVMSIVSERWGGKITLAWAKSVVNVACWPIGLAIVFSLLNQGITTWAFEPNGVGFRQAILSFFLAFLILMVPVLTAKFFSGVGLDTAFSGYMTGMITMAITNAVGAALAAGQGGLGAFKAAKSLAGTPGDAFGQAGGKGQESLSTQSEGFQSAAPPSALVGPGGGGPALGPASSRPQIGPGGGALALPPAPSGTGGGGGAGSGLSGAQGLLSSGSSMLSPSDVASRVSAAVAGAAGPSSAPATGMRAQNPPPAAGAAGDPASGTGSRVSDSFLSSAAANLAVPAAAAVVGAGAEVVKAVPRTVGNFFVQTANAASRDAGFSNLDHSTFKHKAGDGSWVSWLSSSTTSLLGGGAGSSSASSTPPPIVDVTGGPGSPTPPPGSGPSRPSGSPGLPPPTGPDALPGGPGPGVPAPDARLQSWLADYRAARSRNPEGVPRPELAALDRRASSAFRDAFPERADEIDETLSGYLASADGGVVRMPIASTDDTTAVQAALLRDYARERGFEVGQFAPDSAAPGHMSAPIMRTAPPSSAASASPRRPVSSPPPAPSRRTDPVVGDVVPKSLDPAWNEPGALAEFVVETHRDGTLGDWTPAAGDTVWTMANERSTRLSKTRVESLGAVDPRTGRPSVVYGSTRRQAQGVAEQSASTHLYLPESEVRRIVDGESRPGGR